MKKKLSLVIAAALLLSSCGNSSDKDAEISRLQEQLAELENQQTSAAENQPVTESTTPVETTGVTTELAADGGEASILGLIGKTVGEAEEFFGEELIYRGMAGGPLEFSAFVPESGDSPYTVICCRQMNDPDSCIITGFEIAPGGYVTDDIYCGMSYNEMVAAAPGVVGEFFVIDYDYYASAAINIGSADISALWYSPVSTEDTPCDIISVRNIELEDSERELPDETSYNEESGTPEIEQIPVDVPVDPGFGEDIWDVMPYIDETPLEYLDYYYRDDIDGIIVCSVIQRGITKIRLPAYISGIPVVAVDFRGSQVKQLVMPDTVRSVAINKEIIEYINIPPEAEFVDTDTDYDKKIIKGIHISSRRNKYIEFDLTELTDTDFYYNGKMYNSENAYEIFLANHNMAMLIEETTLKKTNKAAIELSVPEGVTKYSSFAFSNNLKKLTLPASIKEVTNTRGISSLEEVYLSEGIEKIGEKAFYSCSSLKTVALPDSLTYIDNHAFDNTIIENITIPDNVTYIGDHAFSCSDLKSVEMPESLTYIGMYAFSNSNLESITIPNNTTFIGEHAFYNCQRLSNVVLGDSVEKIDDLAFKCCDLKEIIIPDSVTEIGTEVFAENKNLKKAYIGSSLYEISSRTFENCEKLSDVTISEGVTIINVAAFFGCPSLTYIEFPKSIKDFAFVVFTGPEYITISFRGKEYHVELADNYLTDDMENLLAVVRSYW